MSYPSGSALELEFNQFRTMYLFNFYKDIKRVVGLEPSTSRLILLCFAKLNTVFFEGE